MLRSHFTGGDTEEETRERAVANMFAGWPRQLGRLCRYLGKHRDSSGHLRKTTVLGVSPAIRNSGGSAGHVGKGKAGWGRGHGERDTEMVGGWL